MKRVTLTLMLLLLSTMMYGQSFIIDENGIVKCEGVEIGSTGMIFGEEYESVDRELLIQRRNEGGDLTKVCVSNVTDMSEMFYSSQFNQPIGNWDVSNVTNMSSMFSDSPFNQPIENWDVSSVTDMSWMFSDSPFNQPIGNWDVSNVTNMSGMFRYSQFNQPIGNWDVSSVTDMSWMFSDSPFNQPIGNWDVSSVTDMNSMFESSPFNHPIGNWDVSSVTNMRGMFIYSQFNQPIGNWDVSSVTNMRGMFVSSPFNQPIENWDVSSVTDMEGMFWGSPFNQSIVNWDVSSVTDMDYMFYSSQFNQPIGNWDVSSVTNMEGMFFSSQFNQPIGNWDVSSVTDMSYMFRYSQFNQPIGNWDVSSVTNMGWMFSDSQFNQPIENWDVSSVTDMEGMFWGSPFNKSIGNWDVSSVTDMRGMFYFSQFNQPIENWDVSSVTDMSLMFYLSQFNQSIENWDVSSVTDMREMFRDSQFNQPIGNWDVSSVTDMSYMFYKNYQFNQPIVEWCVRFIPSEPSDFSSNSPLTEENKPIWGTCPQTNSQSFTSNWNLVSVPVEMEDYSYSTLFPNSTEGTLYSFSDGYVSEETLTPLVGYWINLTEGDSLSFSGERLFPSTLSLQSQWNLIGSMSKSGSLSDPNEIIIPGTLYGFNNGYFSTETIESGRGYWVSTSSEGDVELIEYEPTDTPTLFQQPLRSPSVLSRFDELQFHTNDEFLSQLYFNGTFETEFHPLQTQLPPIPPKGSFDVRTSDGKWITEQSQIRIRIQQSDTPVTCTFVGEHLYEIQFFNGTLQPIGGKQISDGSEPISIPSSTQWMDVKRYDVEEQSDLPTQFSLSQNYPNPFNPSTQIEFSLPESVWVKLSVYTITGQLVSTLVNETLSVGTHSVSFDGGSYPSGVYLYRLQTPSFTQSKMMNLIK